VTGANGYIGRAIALDLAAHGHHVICGSRGPSSDSDLKISMAGRYYGDLQSGPAWTEILDGVDMVVHAAGIAHSPEPRRREDEELFHAINGTAVGTLARACIDAGVKRVILVSTIAVHGTVSEAPISEDSPIAPGNAYARSKYHGEQLLIDSLAGGPEWTIVRPAMVYGPAAPGNFFRLVRLIKTGLPLPLGSVENQRSLLFIDNLTDLIRGCVELDGAAGQVFTAADATSLSTPELIRLISTALGQRPRLFATPPGLLRFLARRVGLERQMSSLLDSYRVDISCADRILHWQPPVATRDGVGLSVRGL
jgi:nucleoside-diphosphate-sugar epimerase